MAPTRAALAALKRLDTVVAAALLAIGLMPVPAGWLCSEASCRSAVDTVILVAFTVGSAVVIVALLWRTTRRWWTRVLALPLAAYAGVQLQAFLAHHGSWALVGELGARCVVRGGAPQDEVHRSCGEPTYRCEGTKFIEPARSWNPLELTVCGFSGDVYRDRLVTYDCRGRVARVEGFDPGPPETSRPQGCLSVR
jgi:hypothetical protein